MLLVEAEGRRALTRAPVPRVRAGRIASADSGEVAPVVAKFVDGMPRRFEVATGDVRLSGALIEIGATMGRAEKIELLTVRK